MSRMPCITGRHVAAIVVHMKIRLMPNLMPTPMQDPATWSHLDLGGRTGLRRLSTRLCQVAASGVSGIQVRRQPTHNGLLCVLIPEEVEAEATTRIAGVALFQ